MDRPTGPHGCHLLASYFQLLFPYFGRQLQFFATDAAGRHSFAASGRDLVEPLLVGDSLAAHDTHEG